MNQREWFLQLLDRFPILDLTWEREVQDAWWRCYNLFWCWACRLIVNDAIERFVQASPTAIESQLGEAHAEIARLEAALKLVAGMKTIKGARRVVDDAMPTSNPDYAPTEDSPF